MSRALAFAALLCLPSAAPASTSGNPATDPQFLSLPDGTSLRAVSVNGRALSLTRGTGEAFGSAQRAAYENLKRQTQQPGTLTQWVLMDLDRHQVIEQSAGTDRRQFGASVSKIFVAGTLLDKQAGRLRPGQLQLLSDMIVVSSNTAWSALQAQIGDGDFARGMEPNYRFTQRMGYARTRGWSGSWNGTHGNELTARELAEYLYDTYQARYPGAEIVWKILHTARTGSLRAKKYLPADLYVGGKTGTYDGATPMSEGPTEVKVRHHVLALNVRGHQYGLVILANTGSEETAALLAGGLLRDAMGYGR